MQAQIIEAYWAAPLQAARDAKARDETVVGYLDGLFPIELARAAGCRPVLVGGGLCTDFSLTDEVMDPSEPRLHREMMQKARSGDLSCLDLLVIGREDTWLYYNLKEAYRQGLGANFPDLCFYDFIPSIAPGLERFNRQEMTRLTSALERKGSAISDATLETAISEQTDLARQVQSLHDARLSADLSGSEGLKLMRMAHLMTPSQFQDAIGGRKQSQASNTAPKCLLTSGSPPFQSALHTVLEMAGLHIAAEDSWLGSRSADTNQRTTEQPLDHLLNKYTSQCQSPLTQPQSLRYDGLNKALSSGEFDVLTIYSPHDEKQFGWDVPSLQRLADKHNLPTCMITGPVGTDEGEHQIRSEVRDFLNAHHLTGETI